jgi:hypothetical protein
MGDAADVTLNVCTQVLDDAMSALNRTRIGSGQAVRAIRRLRPRDTSRC